MLQHTLSDQLKMNKMFVRLESLMFVE